MWCKNDGRSVWKTSFCLPITLMNKKCLHYLIFIMMWKRSKGKNGENTLQMCQDSMQEIETLLYCQPGHMVCSATRKHFHTSDICILHLNGFTILLNFRAVMLIWLLNHPCIVERWEGTLRIYIYNKTMELISLCCLHLLLSWISHFPLHVYGPFSTCRSPPDQQVPSTHPHPADQLSFILHLLLA